MSVESEKLDKKGNLIYQRINGIEYWYEYDDNNCMIHYKDSDGKEHWFEYTEKIKYVKLKITKERFNEIKNRGKEPASRFELMEL